MFDSFKVTDPNPAVLHGVTALGKVGAKVLAPPTRGVTILRPQVTRNPAVLKTIFMPVLLGPGTVCQDHCSDSVSPILYHAKGLAAGYVSAAPAGIRIVAPIVPFGKDDAVRGISRDGAAIPDESCLTAQQHRFLGGGSGTPRVKRNLAKTGFVIDAGVVRLSRRRTLPTSLAVRSTALINVVGGVA
jgi:hypothetical protein